MIARAIAERRGHRLAGVDGRGTEGNARIPPTRRRFDHVPNRDRLTGREDFVAAALQQPDLVLARRRRHRHIPGHARLAGWHEGHLQPGVARGTHWHEHHPVPLIARAIAEHRGDNFTRVNSCRIDTDFRLQHRDRQRSRSTASEGWRFDYNTDRLSRWIQH